MKRLFWIAAVGYFEARSWMTPLSPPVSSGPMVEERVEYYEVSGSSARELELAIRLRGPKGRPDHPGERAVATTTWDVRWETHYSGGETGCAITSFSTSVRIFTTLPRWPGRVAGSPLAERWDDLMQVVAAHERGHAENGVRAAKAIQDRVSALESAWTCQALEDWIQSMAEALIDKYRKEDIEYDRAAQGVMFRTEGDGRSAWIPSRGRTPLRPKPPVVADSELSETDRRRLAGTAELEADMAQVSATADRADVAWRRYVEGCRLEIAGVSAAAVVGGRDWFGYAWATAESARPTAACAEAGPFYGLVDQVKHGMCNAEERARRSYVYPGTRRELRARYRLAWDGWDRVCR